MEVFVMKRFLMMLLGIVLLSFLSCNDSSNPASDDDNGDGNEVFRTSKTITASQGGTISVTDANGNRIVLSIPRNGLYQDTEIIMTALNVPLESPYKSYFMNGVDIQPEDLLLKEPAQLSFTTNTILGKSDGAFAVLVRSPDSTLPLGLLEVDGNTVMGDIYHFSEYTSMDAAAGEMNWQAYALGAQLELDPAGTWQVDYANTAAAISVIRKLELLGEDSSDLSAKLEQYLEKSLEKFLKKPEPSDCDEQYMEELFKYNNIVNYLGVDSNTELVNTLEQRTSSQLDKCGNRFLLDIIYSQTMQLPDGTDNFAYSGQIEFYMTQYSGEEMGVLEGSGTLTVEGGGSTQTDSEVCTWTRSGRVQVKVGGSITDMEMDGHAVPALNIQLTMTYDTYKLGQCCDKDGDCYDMGGPDMQGQYPAYTLQIPIEDGHTITQNLDMGPSSNETTYILHVIHFSGL